MRSHANPRVQSYAVDVADEINLCLRQRRVPEKFLLGQDDLFSRLTSRDYLASPEDDAVDVALAINGDILAQADIASERDAVEPKLLDYVDLVAMILRVFVSRQAAEQYRGNNADKAGTKTLEMH